MPYGLSWAARRSRRHPSEIERYKECSATADALGNADHFRGSSTVLSFGIPTLVIGAILGWALGRLGRYASRFWAAKPKAMSDTMLE